MRSGLQNEVTRSKPPLPDARPAGRARQLGTDWRFLSRKTVARRQARHGGATKGGGGAIASRKLKPNSPRGSEPRPRLPTDESRSLPERNHLSGCRLRLGIFRKSSTESDNPACRRAS
jgi:hypothetical protein